MGVFMFSLLSGLLDALSRVPVRTTKLHALVLVAVGLTIPLPLYLLLLVLQGVPNVVSSFWFYLAWHVPLMVTAQWFLVIGHRRMELSRAAPYLALTPLFMLVTSSILVGVTPTIAGYVGVALIPLGILVLELKKTERGWLLFSADKGALYFIAVALIYSITANLDKLAIDASSVAFYLLIDHTLIALCSLLLFFTLSYFPASAIETRDIMHTIKQERVLVGAYGILFGVSVIVHMYALTLTEHPEYVIALKRAGTIGFATLSSLVFLSFTHQQEEKWEDFPKKICAGLLAGIGVVLIVVYGTP